MNQACCWELSGRSPSRLSSRLSLMCWKSAPTAATPKVPPTMRLIERMPEARPAFVTSTAFIAAVDIGDIVSPIPRPISAKVGRR